MLNLKKLSFKNIGRFTEEQSISFENLSNLVQIDGNNRNTGGSSGSGKSTIFNALDFLFGLNSIPNSQLQSRLTDDSIFVEGEFDLDGQPLTIYRSKKLKITLNGEVTTGSSKLAEEKLDQIIAIHRSLFGAMLHKKQGQKGFFLNFTPSEMNSFLTDCLGLGNFKNNIINLDIKIGDLSKKIISLTSTFESHKAGLKASQDAIIALGEAPVEDVDKNAIIDLKTKMDSIKAGLEGLLVTNKRDEKEFVLLNKPKLELVPFDSYIIEQHEQELNNIQTNINKLLLTQKDKENKDQQLISNLKLKQSELNNKVQQSKDAKVEAIKIATEISKIRKSTCPKCEQSWLTDNIKTEESNLLENVKKLRETILIGEQSLTELDSVQKELMLFNKPKSEVSDEEVALRIQESHLKEDLATAKENKRKHEENCAKSNRLKQDNFDNNYKVFRESQVQATEQVRGQLDIYRRSFDAAIMKLKNFEENRKRYDISFGKLQAQEFEYQVSCEKISKELNDLIQQLGITEELKKAVKSYLSCSFDEALEVISENATKMIQNIPNMQTATVQLDGTRETKDGKVKEEVNAVLHMDGEENIPIKTLSGGERASTDLAIDIAVLNFIEERSNIGCNIMILDEPFGGLDTANIEMVLEVLKNANTHKKLIIVDHSPLVKEQISDRITVIRDGLTSKVT